MIADLFYRGQGSVYDEELVDMRHFKVENNRIFPMHQGVKEFYLKRHLQYKSALDTLISDIRR